MGAAAPRLPTPPALRRDRQEVVRGEECAKTAAPRCPVGLRAPSHFPAAPDLWGYGMVTFWPLSLTGQAFIAVGWRSGGGWGGGSRITLRWNGRQPQFLVMKRTLLFGWRR